MRIEPTGANPAQEPRKIKDAARQFEGVLIAQLLRSAREPACEDEAGATMLEIGQEHLAQAIAAQGGLGLANLIVQGLTSPQSRGDAERRSRM